MKIADSQSIKTGERDMILSIMKKIDPEVLAAIAARNLSPSGMEFVDGDMAIVDNRIVYRMNLQVTVGMTVMFDREGNLVVGDMEDQEYDVIDLVDEGEADLEGEEGLGDEETADDDFLDEEAPLSDEMELPGENQDAPQEPDNLDAIILKNKDFWSSRSVSAQDQGD